MGFNFNYNNSKEYEMFGNMVHEEINLYGLTVKYFKTDRIGVDSIFGEHQSIKVNNKDVFEFNVKLAEDSGFTNGGDFFGKFGLNSQASLTMYVSAKTMAKIHPDLYDGKGYDDILNNIIKLPNGKFMEITGFEDEVEGHNNMFTYADDKKIFKLTTRAYTQNRDELDGLSDEYERIDLDKAFGIAETAKQEQDLRATTEVQIVVTDVNNDGIPETVQVPKVPLHVKKNPFGSLG